MSGELAKRLLRKSRKIAGTVVVELDDDTSETLTIIKPTVGDRLRVVDEAKAAGELDEKSEPKGNREQILLGARVVQALVWKDGLPVFEGTNLQDIIDWPAFEDVSKACATAFAGEAIAKN